MPPDADKKEPTRVDNAAAGKHEVTSLFTFFFLFFFCLPLFFIPCFSCSTFDFFFWLKFTELKKQLEEWFPDNDEKDLSTGVHAAKALGLITDFMDKADENQHLAMAAWKSRLQGKPSRSRDGNENSAQVIEVRVVLCLIWFGLFGLFGLF